MTDRVVRAGRRQTAQVRHRLRRLGPLAAPLALLLTIPSWTLVQIVIAIVAIWRRDPLAYGLLALAVAAIGATAAATLPN